ncbi:hypothetical protein [Spiroplasma tabanidicola]|uniref:Uncharacterized protein n=1 Tax=Spiroplasma tabanidicola TaxID=324079 RepID=A0A6I6C781_9MOLU|nr:hypothetical protein [Spiroplasma tabanidicola]QGS52070.1 hypothetical protein STABA_v1c07130 [Spiroplasma tabanidicola]
MGYIIDADWNVINIYEGKKLIKKENAMVLRNLLSNEIIEIGDGCTEKLKENINMLAINFSENRKINSFEDFEVRIFKLLETNNIKNFKFVNRYNLKKQDNIEMISEIDFLNSLIEEENEVYIELRKKEIIIFFVKEQKIEIIRKGYVNILSYINSYFYLNHNCTLNTKKTIDLLNKISKNIEVKSVICRSYEDGSDVLIKVEDFELLLKPLKNLKEEVNTKIVKYKNIKFNNDYEEVFKYVS